MAEPFLSDHLQRRIGSANYPINADISLFHTFENDLGSNRLTHRRDSAARACMFAPANPRYVSPVCKKRRIPKQRPVGRHPMSKGLLAKLQRVVKYIANKPSQMTLAGSVFDRTFVGLQFKALEGTA